MRKPPRMSRTRSHERTRYRSDVVDRAPLTGSGSVAKAAFEFNNALRRRAGFFPTRRFPNMPWRIVLLLADDGHHVVVSLVHVTVRVDGLRRAP